MSILGPRKAKPLARVNRRARDDARFIIATEDTFAPKQYFAAFQMPRISIEVVETNDGLSAARHVVARLKAIHDEAKRRDELQDNDQFWVLLDTDHWVDANHVAAFSRAVKEAEDMGFHVAVSNPGFELWLLLHVSDVGNVSDCASVEQELRRVLGTYSKTNTPTARLMHGLEAAVARARALDVSGRWPQRTGTQVFRVIENLRRT